MQRAMFNAPIARRRIRRARRLLAGAWDMQLR
jgi:hypothetical protein